MSRSNNGDTEGLSRRKFLGSTAAASAASVLAVTPTGDVQATSQPRRPVSSPPSASKMAREVGASQPPAATRAVQRPGSDLMVQVLRDMEIEFVASNPGSSFEGLQESIINYGSAPNKMPEFISALHEESAVDMAHGYARCQGRPMCALIQGTVGLQHASMAIYQAFHGSVPMIVLAGNDEENFIKAHTGEDIAALVRPYTKWDAQPATLEETLLALQEAYRQAITPPCAPTLVILDSHIQKQEAGDLPVPRFAMPTIPGISKEQATHIATALLAAQTPHISVGRLRTPEGVNHAVRLAELVGASVDTQAANGPMSFPQRHPLCRAALDKASDYVLGLEMPATQTSIQGPHLRELDDRDTAGVNFGWNGRPGPPAPIVQASNGISADAQASLSLLIAAVEAQMTPSQSTRVSKRAAGHASVHHKARLDELPAVLEAKRKGWNASPVSLARLYAELWPLIKDLDWCLASPSIFSSRHHVDLWDHNKPYSYLGVYPAAALGYCIGASTGAALAARERKRIVINIQGDGDINYAPGALWTAAHHKLPMLTIMHNNRAWHMELMYLTHMAGVRGRGTDRAHIGTTFRDPYIDYAKMAQAYGMDSEGPISDPSELAAALQRGVDSVANGQPYLIDVLTQPR